MVVGLGTAGTVDPLLWAELAVGRWPSSMLVSMCYVRRSRTCMLGLPQSAANAFAAVFLKGIHSSPGGDSLALVIFAGQRPQWGGILDTPGEKI